MLHQELPQASLLAGVHVACALMLSANISAFFEQPASLDAPNLSLQRLFQLFGSNVATCSASSILCRLLGLLPLASGPLRAQGDLIAVCVEFSLLSFLDELTLCLQVLLIRVEDLVLLFLRALLVLQRLNDHLPPEVAHQELERDRALVHLFFLLFLAAVVTPGIRLLRPREEAMLVRVLCWDVLELIA